MVSGRLKTRAEIADHLTELKVRQCLERDDWALVCDPSFEALFARWGVEARRILPAARLADPLPDSVVARRFIVCTEAPEAAIQHQLKSQQRSSLGLFSQIIPRLSARLRPEYPARHRGAPELEFAILCLARSGSTLLCRELNVAGCGRPIEHMRRPVEILLRNRPVSRFDFPRWWDLVRGGHTVDGVFATKLIFGFWRDVEPLLSADERASILEFLSRAPVIYIERTDKVAQAVSDQIAELTGVWHLWRGVSRGAYESTSETIDPDMDGLVATYQDFCDQEAGLKAMMHRLGIQPIRIDYDDLVADPKRTIAGVVERLGRRLPDGYGAGALALQSTTTDAHHRLRGRLQSELEQRGLARQSAQGGVRGLRPPVRSSSILRRGRPSAP